MKQQTFGRSRPSIAWELQYRRALEELITKMQKDVENELKRYCDNEIVADAASVRWVQIMKALRLKWYREFDAKGRELAKWFTDKTNKRTMAQIQRKLKEVGMAITPSYTAAQKQLISEIVAENVGMIKSIPQQYLRGIQKVTAGAFKRGGDRATLTKYLEKVLKRVDDKTRHRAILIARDQTNKATQQLVTANAQALGATKGRWIHVPGKYSSRKTHVEMNGKVFPLLDGLYDKDVHRNVKPGELIYCNCQFEVLMPGFDE
jgi:uncharacterized protein with gpF-like domain